MSILYPQIDVQASVSTASKVQGLPVIAIAEKHCGFDHPAAQFTAVGGSRCSQSRLKSIREELVSCAVEAGYPNRGSESKKLWFDMASAAVLHTKMDICLGEAAKPGVWSFLACVLAPDIVRWRFPGGETGTAIERFVGGRRNVLQRVWWRAETLSSDDREPRYELLGLLGEDELVQIMERPQLIGFRPLALALAEQLLETSLSYPKVTRRQLIRESQKKILRLAAFVRFEALSAKQIGEIVAASYVSAASASQRATL